MLASYKEETEHRATHLLLLLSKALGVSADELLELEKSKDNTKSRYNRNSMRFSQMKKLPLLRRKQIVQILNAFLENEKLKKAVQM